MKHRFFIKYLQWTKETVKTQKKGWLETERK